MLFAALLNHWGQLGPAEIEPKRIYTFKHCVRRASRRKLPFSLPPAHPFNPLLGLRIAALDLPEDARYRVIDALFDATWGGGPGIDTPEKVASILDAAGFEGWKLIEHAKEPAHKAEFRACNDASIAAGVFGVPTLAIDDELFWGSDVEEDIALRLEGRDPIGDRDWAGLTALPIGSERPR